LLSNIKVKVLTNNTTHKILKIIFTFTSQPKTIIYLLYIFQRSKFKLSVFYIYIYIKEKISKIKYELLEKSQLAESNRKGGYTNY
jgi:hypothetical protein